MSKRIKIEKKYCEQKFSGELCTQCMHCYNYIFFVIGGFGKKSEIIKN